MPTPRTVQLEWLLRAERGDHAVERARAPQTHFPSPPRTERAHSASPNALRRAERLRCCMSRISVLRASEMSIRKEWCIW